METDPTHTVEGGHSDDPGIEGEAKLTDFAQNEEVDAGGRAISNEVLTEELVTGIDIEEDPWDVHVTNHPTPDHPSGRLEP